MGELIFFLSDEAATERFGATLWRHLPQKCVVFLQGDLGMGKTTLVRGFLRAGGYQAAVKSPTYNLVEEYTVDNRKIFHFDLYRLNEPEELEWMGIRDYFDQSSMCFIEWPAQGGAFLPAPDLVLQFMPVQAGRALKIDYLSSVIKKCLSNVIKQKDTDIL